MIFTRPLISKSSSPFDNSLVTVPKAPITISIFLTLMFYRFLIPWRGPGTYPSIHFLSVLFCGQPGYQSPQFCKFSFFFVGGWFLLGLVFWLRLVDPFVCQNPIGVYVSFSRTDPIYPTPPLGQDMTQGQFF